MSIIALFRSVVIQPTFLFIFIVNQFIMAVVQYSGLITGIKGKMGGTIFQGGVAGDTIKTSGSIPSGAKLTKADAGRVVLPKKIVAVLASAWRSLSDAQRTTWALGAVNYPAINKFGLSYTPSGYQVYMTLNSKLATIGVAALTDCPTPVTIVDIPEVTVLNDGGTGLNLDMSAAVAATQKMTVWATRPMAAGLQPRPSDYKMIDIIVNVDGDGPNINAEYLAIYGQIPTGSIIYFRFQGVMIATGQKGVFSYSQILIS